MKRILFVFFTLIGVLLTPRLNAQWVEKNNGLYGGRVHAFAVHGSDIFAGTEGGIFLSSNNGATWTAVNNGLTYQRIRAITIIDNKIFAATYGGGVFRSTDNGANWTAVNTGLWHGGSSLTIQALAAKGSNLFAGGDGEGAFRSTDYGASWTSINNGIHNNINAFVVSGSNLFAATYGSGGVYVSTNNGGSWTALNAGLTNRYVNALIISGSSMFAGTEGGGVFRSIDNGATWTAVNSGFTNLNVNTLAINGTTLYAGTGGGMFVSTNNGASWNTINNGLDFGFGGISVIASAVKGGDVFIGTTLGVFVSSNNGLNWTNANTGITSTTVWTLLTHGNSVFAGTLISNTSGLFASFNNGDSWQSSNSGFPIPFAASSAKIGSNLFVGGAGVFLSNNNGLSWSSVSSGLPNFGVLALTSSGSNLLAGTSGGGVFISSNNGASWTAINSGLTEGLIECLAANGNNFFAGTRDGVFRSTNNGANWTSEGKAAMQVSNIPPSIVSMAVMGSTIFAATLENGLFRSLDNGTTWAKVLDEDNLHLLILDDGSIFAGNESVFVSTNNGSNWVDVGTGLPNAGSSSLIYSLAVNDTHLFAGTLFKGAWSRPLSEFPIAQPEVTITSFTPTSGAAGAIVTINGTNFSSTPTNNIVKFNGVTATVTASTATSITAIVPAGSSTGSILVTAKGKTATSSSHFTVIGNAPVATAATVISPTGFTANWNASAGATGYRLDVSSDNFVTFVAGFNDKTISVTSDVVTGLMPNTPYKYRVRAASVNGTSGNSNVIDVTTLALPPPEAPVATAATGILQTGFTANWNAVVIANEYRLDVSADNFATFAADFNNKAVSGTSVTVTGLTANTAYTYRVRAASANGLSANSNVIGVRTLMKQDQTINFEAVADRTEGDNAFTLNAVASSGLAVSFESLSMSKVSVSGNTVTIVAAGTASIRARQDGNASFNAAANVERSFCIKPTKPTITLTNANTDTPTLTSSATSGNQWFLNGNVINGATNVTHTVSLAGVYTVLTTVEGCPSELSDPQAVIVTGDLDKDASALIVFPNPAKDRVYMSLGAFDSGSDVQIQLIDFNGRVVFQKIAFGGGTTEIALGGYARGSYIISAHSGSISERVKILIY
ncbi:MAG: fibronectin type III domain-containing protein [Cyclobacteriaceae bacterium]